MKLDSFLKYFPPPRFVDPLKIGISFSDLSIKAVLFEKGSFGPVVKSIMVPLEEGIIKEGLIIKQDELVKKLKEVKEKIDSPFVCFTIPDEVTYIFTATVPVVEGKDATESVAFSIEENVPISLSDAIFDFVPISVKQNENGHEGSFVVTACVKNEVEKIVSSLEASGFVPVCGVHESQAVANAVVPKNSDGFSCVVHVRDNRVGMYLVNKNIVTFATIRILSPLDYEKQIKDEYEKFQEYYNKYGDSNGLTIKNIFVCGEFEYAKRAVSGISAMVNANTKVTLANIWTNSLSLHENTPNLPYEKSLSFAGSIGATLNK